MARETYRKTPAAAKTKMGLLPYSDLPVQGGRLEISG